MELFVWFIITSLAVYRTAMMLSSEEGPFRLFELFRNLFTTPNWVGRGVRCFMCLSFWVGIILAILVGISLPLNILTYPVFALGTSGLAVFMYRFHRRE